MKYKKVLVLGGTGFLGKHLQRFKPDWTYWGSRDVDLFDGFFLKKKLEDEEFDAIVYLAAKVGGIKKNESNNAKMLVENTAMTINVFNVARDLGIKRILAASSTCAYPDLMHLVDNKFVCEQAVFPMDENDFWDGKPYESNFGYGESKRLLQSLCKTYSKDYGMICSSFALSNLYGPMDNFDLGTSHFVAATIKKVYDLKNLEDTLYIWGDGTPLRQQLYVEDAAVAIPILLDNWEESEFPIPLTPDENLSIKQMVNIIKKIADKHNQVQYTSDFQGQYRKDVNNQLFKNTVPFFDFTSFEDGAKITYNWYKRRRLLEEI